MTLQAKKESNDSSPLARSLTLEHVDPRNHHLVCGLKNEFNEILADYSYNCRKVNRFVPYRVCDYPAPVTFGDIGEFLIQDKWVICEFGGTEWWIESGRIGCGQTAPASKKQKEAARKTGLRNKENGTLREAGRKGGAIGGKITGRRNVESGHLENLRSWKYECLVTGYVSTAAGLSTYQRKRGIDTSLKKRVS